MSNWWYLVLSCFNLSAWVQILPLQIYLNNRVRAFDWIIQLPVNIIICDEYFIIYLIIMINSHDIFFAFIFINIFLFSKSNCFPLSLSHYQKWPLYVLDSVTTKCCWMSDSAIDNSVIDNSGQWLCKDHLSQYSLFPKVLLLHSWVYCPAFLPLPLLKPLTGWQLFHKLSDFIFHLLPIEGWC